MKKLRRVTSLILVFTLLFTLTGTVFAKSNNYYVEGNPENIVITLKQIDKSVCEISIRNDRDHAIANWTLSFKTNFKLSGTEGASCSVSQNNTYTFMDQENRAIASGEVFSFTVVSSKKKNSEIHNVSFEYDEVEEEDYIYDTTDTDGDEVYDWIEEYFGTDSDKDDTDADGLTDFDEIYVTLTDSVKFDSIGEGSSDAEYDFDEDGLKNFEEVIQGSDPHKADTDADTLNDADEILHGTDPADSDTDKDGMPDGIEIPYGMNPLEPDTLNDGILDGDRQFNVAVENDEAFDEYGIRTTVKLSLHGSQIHSLSVDKIDKNDEFLSDKVPGFLGNAFEYTVDGTFDTAEISYEFPEEMLSNPDFEPAIFYFDEEEQILTPLENQIVSGNTVTAQTTHFSKYILLNKKEFVKVWKYEIKFDSSEESYANVDVAFVIDSSGSMTSNDRDNVRKSVTKNFINKLSSSDRGAVIDFDDSARVCSGLTSDKDVLSSAVDRIDSSGGTNLSVGIQAAIDLFTSSSYVNNDSLKIIIMLTDGDGTYSTNLTQTAKNNGIIIYTVGLGNSVSVSKLKEMAEGTTGNYYPASDAEKLYGIFDDIAEEADLKKDSDSDGVNDYFEKEMNAGRLRLGTGVPLLGMDYQDDDSDDDTLKDGAEISVKKSNRFQNLFNGGTEKIYVKLYSNPTSVDTDGDLIVDSKDDTPLYPFRFEYLGSPEHLNYVEERMPLTKDTKLNNEADFMIGLLGTQFLMDDYYDFLVYKGIKNIHGLAGVDYTWNPKWDKYWDEYCDEINEYVDMMSSVNKELHFFRNNLNRQPETLEDMIGDSSNWTLLSVNNSRYHMFETKFSGSGLYNLKFISNDGKHEGVYINSYGDNNSNPSAGHAATAMTDPINMGTYNFGGEYIFGGMGNNVAHLNYDIIPYKLHGNTPSGGKPGFWESYLANGIRYNKNEAAQKARAEFLTHWDGEVGE